MECTGFNYPGRFHKIACGGGEIESEEMHKKRMLRYQCSRLILIENTAIWNNVTVTIKTDFSAN